WQEALAKSDIKPEHRVGMVLAATQFLGTVHEWGHAAEILKSNLRLGYVNEPWVYSALSIALQESGGAAGDVGRARLSGVDLGPKDPQAYLQAAKLSADMGNSERAISFCRLASDLRPELAEPYANALLYIDKAKKVDSDAVHWAVSNLLKREWVMDKEV